jgi:iron(III) transport system substrate-binding protein
LQPYVSSEAGNLMEKYLDPNGIWTPQSILPMIIMYNKDLVPEDQKPAGWNDLLDPKWKGQIAYADPAKSASSYTQLVTMMTAFGLDTEEGWDAIKKFVANLDGKILSGSALVYQGVADKEFALGVTSEDAALRYVVNGANVGIIYPVEGTSARTDGNSIIKGAKNLEEAKAFIDFISGKDVHDLLSKEFLRRSVRKDTSFEIEGIVKTEDMAVLPYDAQWASDNKEAVVERFNRIVIGAE